MKSGNAIEVHNITKKFKVFMDKGHTLKEMTLFRNRRRYEEREVLKGISFEVKKGEAIGLIGQNGCGKSTTLKLLTRIMYPDSGTIEMTGRVSSLIELGAGFHPDMSGRQNIYTNASIFGLTRKEIEHRIDDIIAFSELQQFIDNPVRTYSSGMYMRLAFAVAINVDADILLIDEILAVGDSGFQAKCFNRLREIKAAGTTIVIVSHALGQIEQICERSIWIHDGIICEEGEPRRVHMNYLEYMGQKQQVLAEKERVRLEEKKKNSINEEIKKNADEPEENIEKSVKNQKAETGEQKKMRWGNGNAKIKKVSMLNKGGEEQLVFATGESVEIKIEYNTVKKIGNAVIGIGIFRIDGVQCYGTNTRVDGLNQYDIDGSGIVSVKIEALNLIPGKYSLDVAIECDDGIPVDYYREVCIFETYSQIGDVGVARLTHVWQFGI